MADEKNKRRQNPNKISGEGYIRIASSIAKVPTVKQPYMATSKTLQEDAKHFLNINIEGMSTNTLLQYKTYLDLLSQATELKKQSAPANKMYDLLLSAHKTKNKYVSVRIKNRFTLRQMQRDSEIALDYFKNKIEQFTIKDKFHKQLVSRGNQLDDEKNKISQEAEEKRKKIIKEAEDYVKELEKKQEEESEERGQLLAESRRMKEVIEESTKEGQELQEQYEKEMKEIQERIEKEKNEEKKKKNREIQKQIEDLRRNIEKYSKENIQLKKDIDELRKKNGELEELSRAFDNEKYKMTKQMDEQQRESVFILGENEEIKERVKTAKMNKEEMAVLLKEYESDNAKIRTMSSLYNTYIKQYSMLSNELFPPKITVHKHD